MFKTSISFLKKRNNNKSYCYSEQVMFVCLDNKSLALGFAAQTRSPWKVTRLVGP